MTVPNLDFSRDRAAQRSWQRVGFALLALALSLQISSALWRWQHLEEIRLDLESKQQRAATKRVAEEGAKLSQEQRKSVVAVQNMLTHLAIPWESLLTAIEMSRTKGIVLESVKPNVEDYSLTITLSTSGFNALAVFVDTLNQQEILRKSTIVSETLEQNSKEILRAVVHVHWQPLDSAP